MSRRWLGVTGLLLLVASGLATADTLLDLAPALLPGEGLAAGLVQGASLLGLALAGALLGRPWRGAARGLGAAAGTLAVAGIVGRGWLSGGVAVGLLLAGGVLAGAAVARWPRALAGLAAATCLLFVPARPAWRVPVTAEGPDQLVVLVTLDTFRADHLGRIGGTAHPVPTPHLDTLADQGLLFSQGVATAPLTLPAHAAMLTGQLPDRVGVLRNGHVMTGQVETVAERLAAAGWRTGAAVSAAVLGRGTGIDRGFSWYDDLLPGQRWRSTTLGGLLAGASVLGEPATERRGDATIERALAWLAAGSGPTFLWVHLYDPHAPYAPPAPYDTLVSPDSPGLPGAPDQVEAAKARVRKAQPLTLLPGPSDLRPQVAAYKGEIAWTDHLVGQLLAALPPEAAVVVAADHGESFLEHDYLLNHGDLLHEPAVRVPILVRGPGLPPGLVVEDPAPQTAIAPTLLALAGLPAEGSLLDRVAGPPPGEELRMFAGTQRSRAILGPFRKRLVGWRIGSEKWIVDSRDGVEHYDLAADPGELDPSAGEGSNTWLARGQAELEALERAGEAAAVAEEQVEALRALGYVE